MPLAAVAAAWSLELSEDVIRCALAAFECDAATAPGRFNTFAYRGATIIADYGHAIPTQIRRWCQRSTSMAANRRLVVISGAGDRRDEDIREQTRIPGAPLTTSYSIRTSASEAAPTERSLALLREGLSGARRTTRIDEVHGEFAAIDTALSRLSQGDLPDPRRPGRRSAGAPETADQQP